MSKIERFLSDPRYQALDDAGKKHKLDLFFNKYVTQDARYAPLDEEGKARVYSKFMSKYYGEPEAKAPKQKTPFSGLKSEVENITSLTTSAEASSTGLVETQTLDRRNKAYQKVMADREEALRIIDRERNLKHVVPQDRVAAGQQYIKKVESMQGAYKYPIKSQYTAAMERLQPNNYTDPIERQVAHEIVNKEKLDKAQREYQRIAERTASATPEERKEIAKSLAAQQTLIDYYATGMTAAERAAYQAGQEGSESFRMVKALGAGSIDLASGVYQLFNPDSKFARTINAYSAGLLEQSGNPLEDAFAQVFYSMPMTLGYFMTSGISGAVGTATKAAAIATKAGEVASLMHSVNINAYITAKKYSEAISGYGSATAVPEGVLLAGSTSALVESAIEMLSDTAQAKIVLGQAKRIGRRGAEQIIKNSLSGKIAGYGTRLATGMAESATTEFLEEITQGASGMIFDVMSNQREVPSLEEAFKELMYSGAVGALGGITFGLGGGIMVQSSNYQNWREVKKQAASGNKHAARLWEARSILDKSNPNGEVTKSDVQRAYDVIKSDLHAVTENRYQEDNPSIAQAMAQMYDAYAMVDMIKSPQQEAVREAIEAGVQRILDQKQATATQEPTQQATESEPQSVEDTIVTLVQEGDIEAAENALNEAIKNGTTGINIPYLRTLVNESKAVAERIAKEEADQKARQDIIDKYGKYAEMSHSELQDEAKKRGLKAGGKSTDIMARLKESDEKPKAETMPAKPVVRESLTANKTIETQQDRAIKESLIAEETPKKASKYESMGYNALQKEAKKHGINSFGIKKAELMARLKESDEKPKAETAPVKAAEDGKAGTQDIDKLYNRIKTTVAGKNSQDVYILKRDLGLLLMPKVRIQEAESVADYYIALREGSVTQAEYDNYIDELIAENRVNDASDAEKSAARKRVDAYRNKKAEDSKPKPQTPKDDGYIRISIGDLIEHYKAMGMDRQRAWKEYIQDTVLSKRVITDSIDAKDFMPYFDRIQFPQKSDKMMPAPVKAAEDIESEVMSRSTFQEQYRQAQEGKLPKGQIDAQLKLYDAMMDTYAREMGITIDEAYAEVIDSVTADEPVEGTGAFDPSNPDILFQGEVTSGAAIESTVIPKKIVSAYRIGYLNTDGTVSPVMVDNKTTRQSYKMGTWYDAETRKSSMAIIPGFHFAYTPSLPQLYKEDGTLDPQRVYYIAEYDATNNYQAEADASGEGFIRGKIPENGFYFRKKRGIKGWVISGKMRPVRVLTMQEVDEINRQNGIETINGMPIEMYKAKQAKYKAKKGIREQNLQQLTRGYIQKMPNGKYRIGIMQPNVTTGLHEQAHLGKSLMEIMANKSPAWASRLKAAEEWCGVKDGKWTTEAEEKFANGYVKFLADGSAPNGKLKTIFAKIKEWIGSILQGLADVKNLDVSNEMRGVYLSMLGISEGKRNLTSEQKVQSIKLKSAMKQDATSDPLKLETEIDSFADSNDLILEGKRTGNKTSFYLNRIDDGKTMIEIHHSNGEYEVNGYHAANNQEVMEQVTMILGDTRYRTTDMPSAAEIAEAEQEKSAAKPKLVKTEWMSKLEEVPHKIEGSIVARRSDWDKSLVSELSGREIVHVYWIDKGDGEVKPYGIQSAAKIMGWSKAETDRKIRQLVNEHKAKEANIKAWRSEAREYKGAASPRAALLTWEPLQAHKEQDFWAAIDRDFVFAHKDNTYRAIPKNQSEHIEAYRREGWDIQSTNQARGKEPIPTQIKSATANVGTFSESNDIRYQIDNAIQSASPDMQDRIAKIMEKQKKVQQAANATYRELTTKIGRTTSVYEWDSMMRKSLVTAIRNAFPGAAPMNIEKYAALEETLGELDPGLEDHAKEIKRIKAQLRRMVAMDKKFRDALEDVSGFSDIADIPFEGLFSALENTNPAAYDRYFKDETFDILLKALPKIKTAYDGQFTMQTLQRIVDVILNGNDPNVGRDVSELAFLQPQRLFAELFGKAGINTINYAYHGTLKLAAYEMEYTPHLRELNRLLMTSDNNRGSAYDGDDLDIIGRTIFEVDGNSEISNKLETIQERLAEWAEENNAVINSKDVEEIYNEKEYLKDIMRGFIAEWNANPERTQKIGIREDYDNPRKYNWGDISDITTKGGKYLYTPGNARERSKQDFSEGLDYDTNIFNAYSNYMYSMTRYMAFYDLANYVEGSSILYASKGGKAGQKKMASGFDLDLSLAQHKSSAYASKMIEDYVRNTIGYHKKDTPKGRLLASARTNVYASLLAANVIMTVLNYNQRNLIHSVVDQNIAMQVRTDVAFWTGLFKPSNEEYPTLSGIMQAYVTANQSLVAELAAEAKRSANQGRTALTRAYYKHSAYNAEMLRLSPFSLAELGNRAYAHAAGVYQVTQNSMAYKEYVASGMSRHQAMERALSEDSNLRRAAITYGGIINAEINADANRAFSPHFFGDASKIKKVAVFLRYGVTIALLELRTYGGARDIKSLLSPDLFRLLTSGNVKAATAAQTIQAGAIMKSMLHPKRIAELVRKGQVSTAKTSKNLITVNEVNMVRDAITWALDVQAKHTEGEFHNIIRGKSGAKQAMAALMAFSVSEVLLRSLLELLFSLIPWWKGKKKFIETDVIENIASVLGLFQGLKTASNVRLGSTLAPDLGVYNPTAKTTTKALSQYVLRLTPYAGFANYMGKVFTGKYFSDLFWDEVYD